MIWQGRAVARKLVIKVSGGASPVLEEVPADNESQLQEQLKAHPELMPLDELGLVGPAVVVGRESHLDSGRVDLVLLGNGGDLALVEFKTGPQNPDFRECLAQLLSYGSGLWGMTLEEFETRVAQPYFTGPSCPVGSVKTGASLAEVVEARWGTVADDAVDWRDRLQAQLRDGGFHYIAVAQRFTPPVLRTLQYLNATMKTARFSAVELVRFAAEGYDAFEARFVVGAEPVSAVAGAGKSVLAGVDDLLAKVADDNYRHALRDLFDGLTTIDGLTVYWGTTGCSLRVPIPNRNPLSIGWVFPPGAGRWMGLTDVTLGWDEGSAALAISDTGRAALDAYRHRLATLPGAVQAKPSLIHGFTFTPSAIIDNASVMVEAIRAVVSALTAP
jgi:hypothetical protein